jgi:hypothetical protein
MFSVRALAYFGPSFEGKMNEARIEKHCPKLLSIPKATARWDCEPVSRETISDRTHAAKERDTLFDCQDMILHSNVSILRSHCAAKYTQRNSVVAANDDTYASASAVSRRQCERPTFTPKVARVVVMLDSQQDDPADHADDEDSCDERTPHARPVRGLVRRIRTKKDSGEQRLLTADSKYMVTNATAYGGTENSLTSDPSAFIVKTENLTYCASAFV